MLVFLCIVLLCLQLGFADDLMPCEISDIEGMQKIADNPDGSYILTADIDMSNVIWTPFEFKGTLNGNGHIIYNLTLDQPGSEIYVAVDGNLKQYDTVGVGLFSVVNGAEIYDLELLNVRGTVNAHENCFVGSFSGGAFDSVFRNCKVSGDVTLISDATMVGIGGIAGFGVSDFDGCEVDMTLTHLDRDYDFHCEQFMGGIFACGHGPIHNCKVKLNGFTSCHGYVHDGGLMGMHYEYDIELVGGMRFVENYWNNHVEGYIQFFEHNQDRRAYCEPYVGERLTPTADLMVGNSHNFERREVFQYDKELLPHDCTGAMSETVTEPTCTELGYSTFVCDKCGYTYTDHYTAPHHRAGEWVLVREAGYDECGIEQRNCTACGELLDERELPQLVRSQGIFLSAEDITMICKGDFALAAIVQPDNALNRDVKWTSSDTEVVTVDGDGRAHAVGPGTAVITCEAVDGGASATCSVKVYYTLWQWMIRIFLLGFLWYK